MRVRVGIGFDIHRLEEGLPLRLGGVSIPHPKGLAGHSDGDALFHAMIDALLGAAGLGSIGEHFPGTPAWENADSGVLLGETGAKLRGAGFEIGNIDSHVLAEAPRLAPWFGAMEARAAAALGIRADQVAVKARTLDGLGAIGRGEAIAAQAVVLVHSGL